MKAISKNDYDWFDDFIGEGKVSKCPEPISTILKIIGTEVWVGPIDSIDFEAISTEDELKDLMNWCSANLENWSQDGEVPIGWRDENDIKKGSIYRFEDGGTIYCDMDDRVWVLDSSGCNYEVTEQERLYTHPDQIFTGNREEVPVVKASSKERELIKAIENKSSDTKKKKGRRK